jgi:hypothetical protein
LWSCTPVDDHRPVPAPLKRYAPRTRPSDDARAMNASSLETLVLAASWRSSRARRTRSGRSSVSRSSSISAFPAEGISTPCVADPRDEARDLGAGFYRAVREGRDTTVELPFRSFGSVEGCVSRA